MCFANKSSPTTILITFCLKCYVSEMNKYYNSEKLTCVKVGKLMVNSPKFYWGESERAPH